MAGVFLEKRNKEFNSIVIGVAVNAEEVSAQQLEPSFYIDTAFRKSSHVFEV